MNGRVDFSSGYFVTVDVLRDPQLPVDVLADAVHLPPDQFLEELGRWAEGPGLPYGITVDRAAGVFAAL